MIYYDKCKDCIHVEHCFGAVVGEEVKKGVVGYLEKKEGRCVNYWPALGGWKGSSVMEHGENDRG